LATDVEILPPLFKKQRGRPPTKLIRKGAAQWKATKCSKCLQTSHNRWKCRFAPAINGRQQRARDRELSSLSSDLGSKPSDGLPSSLDSDSDSDAPHSAFDESEAEGQAESDLYHMRIRRAHEIVNRRHQEWGLTEKNDESDSGPSELASSLFNGMKGIQMGSDIEVGGGMEDLGDTGATINSGMSIQGTTNPRTMRSGRIIKYTDE
jgi:hypothetical protein